MDFVFLVQTIFNSLQHNQGLGGSLPYDHCSSEGVTRVGRYSVEERRERIKRYRSKRNQRNFHKKIKVRGHLNINLPIT